MISLYACSIIGCRNVLANLFASIINGTLALIQRPSRAPLRMDIRSFWSLRRTRLVSRSSTGNPTRIAGELFKMMTGVDVVHVPSASAAAAITGLLSGQVQVMFATIPASIQSIREDKLRALAITSAMRSALLPDIPTVGDFVPGYEASGFQGLGAPRNTPAEIIDKLNKEINAALANPKFKESLTEFGNTALPLSPAAFGNLMRDEIEKLTKVIKFAGMKPG
jgi:tripartite-type tricarboxylate transporter receptor subunit TctC